MEIKPVYKNKNTLTIVFAFNNDYSKYFGVALQSLIKNLQVTHFYDIVVFSSDISLRNQKLLLKMLPENFSLRFFDISEYISNLLKDIYLPVMKYWSVEMYYRIIIPLIMPNYKKVLYVDSDIVFNDDICPLFDINFDGKKILAVQDSFNLVSTLKESEARSQYIKKILKLESTEKYFNSGVILFDITAFDSNDYLKCIKSAFNQIQKTYYPDQDLLNYIFNNQIKLIDLKWNLQYHLSIFHKRDLPTLDKTKLAEYYQTFENPAIIHYTSPAKPWNKPNVELAEFFWKYARPTVFYEEILSAMHMNDIFESRFATNLYLKLQNNKKFILWGASLFLENFLKEYEINKKYYPNIIGIIDKSPSRCNSFMEDYKIFTPDVLNKIEADEIILTIINSLNERYEEVKAYLKENDIKIELTRL